MCSVHTRVFDGADEVCAPAELLPHQPDDGAVLVETDRLEVVHRVRGNLEAERAADAVAHALSVTTIRYILVKSKSKHMLKQNRERPLFTCTRMNKLSVNYRHLTLFQCFSYTMLPSHYLQQV